MGLRCSLLGHDYDEPDVEREREERGSEVVITVRDVKKCSRCGSTSIVSENKEVTSIETSDGEDVKETDASTAVADESAEIGFDTDEPVDPEDDDGVILEDDGESEHDGRQRGQWPDAEDEQSDETQDEPTHEWPNVDDADDGYDAEPSYGESTDVEFGGGLAPERSNTDTTAAENEDVEFIESAGDDPQFEVGSSSAEPSEGGESDTGFTRTDTVSQSSTQTNDVETEFVCPECGYVSTTFGSSLRAGDICPECRSGYLAEQEA